MLQKSLLLKTSSLSVQRWNCWSACLQATRRRFLSTDPSKDAEKKDERERLKKELGRLILGGSLYDVRAASKNENSKVFETEVLEDPIELPSELRTFTTLSGKDVSIPRPDRPSALLVAFNQLGWSMLEEWKKPLLTNSVPVLQLSVVEGWSARFFKSSIIESMKKSTAQDQHDIVAFWAASFEKERLALRIENRAIGYAFLVDSRGMIRLRGCGKFVEADRLLLQACLNDLRKAKSKS